MVNCNKVNFYSYILRLKSMEKYEVKAKEVKRITKIEPSRAKPTVKVVEIKVS